VTLITGKNVACATEMMSNSSVATRNGDDLSPGSWCEESNGQG